MDNVIDLKEYIKQKYKLNYRVPELSIEEMIERVKERNAKLKAIEDEILGKIRTGEHK